MITENKLFGKLIAGLKFILTPVRNNVRLYIFLYFLSVALCAICNLFGTHNSFFTACLLSLCECYIVCALKEAFGYIKLSWLPVIPTIVLYVSEMFVVFIYRTLYSVDVVQLMAETDSREVSNFFASTFSQPIVWIAPIVVAACVAIALAAPKFEIKKENLKPYLYFIFFALLIWGSSRQIKGYQKVYRSFMGGSLNICSVNVPRMSTPYIRFCYGLVVNNAASKEIPFLKESVERITATKNDNGCPLIVLVIGESFSKHHTPLYRTGYRSTTPFLESMRDKGNLVLFDDAISPSNITSNVFKHMFSTWDETCEDEWTKHSLFTALFKKAGYNVWFYTNQFILAEGDAHDNLGGTIFNHLGLSELQFSRRNKNRYEFDGDLLNELPSMEEAAQQPTLLILHWFGQHNKYSERFPKDFAVFTAEDSDTEFGGSRGKQILADYDNATLYNDHVMKMVIERLADQDAIMLYYSDHGEEIFDWRDFFVRSNEEDLVPEVAHYQYEVPMMFYMSDLFVNNHPEIASSIKESAHRRVILTDIPNVLFDLGGIETEEYRPEHNFIGPDYDTNRTRYIRDNVDYDKLLNK